MNKIFLIGNLTKDPNKMESKSGTSFCKFCIAVKKKPTENDVDYYNCTAFASLGDIVAKYCYKGTKVAVVGSLSLNEYEDKNGCKRMTAEVTCSDVEFLSPKKQTQDTNALSQADITDMDDFEF